MKKISLLPFLIALALLAGIFSFFSIEPIIQLVISVFFILVIGIPHGAIDHILFFEKRRSKPVYFYLMYFGLMAAYIVSWIFFPVYSLGFFLVLSAYHFGQSQFSDLKIPKLDAYILYFSWGVSILSGLVIYNFEEVMLLFASSPDIANLIILFHKETFLGLLIISSLISITSTIYLLLKNAVSLKRASAELIVLALIHLSFYILPLLIGFTLYFSTLHSLKVLNEEFEFLSSKRKQFTIGNFIKLLTPYSIASILSIIAIVATYSLWSNGISAILLGFILISILTLPHSVVMEGFYGEPNQ